MLSQTYGLSPWLALLRRSDPSSVVGSRDHMDRRAGSSFKGVHFALLTIAFAELTRVLFDNWDLVGGTGGYFLKAINPDTNRPL